MINFLRRNNIHVLGEQDIICDKTPKSWRLAQATDAAEATCYKFAQREMPVCPFKLSSICLYHLL
jgi:hypothetical protein